MQITSIGMSNYMLKQAVQVSMLAKQMDQEKIAGQFVEDMMNGVAEISGKGQSLDLKG